MTPDRLAQARRTRAEEISYRRIGKASGISEISAVRWPLVTNLQPSFFKVETSHQPLLT